MINCDDVAQLKDNWYSDYPYQVRFPKNTDTTTPIIKAPIFKVPRFDEVDKSNVNLWLKITFINIYAATLYNSDNSEISIEQVILGTFVKLMEICPTFKNQSMFRRITNAIDELEILFGELEKHKDSQDDLEKFNHSYYKDTNKKQVKWTYNNHPLFLKKNKIKFDEDKQHQQLRTACENLLYKQAILDFLSNAESSVLLSLDSAAEALQTYKNPVLSEMLGKKSKNDEYPFQKITSKKLEKVLQGTRFERLKSEKQNDRELVIAMIKKFPSLSVRKLHKKISDAGVKISKSLLHSLMQELKQTKELEINAIKNSAYINLQDYEEESVKVKDGGVDYTKNRVYINTP